MWLLNATAGYAMKVPAVVLGPPTPEQHSADVSDTSSEEMAETSPCCVSLGSPPVDEDAMHITTLSAQFGSLCEHHMLPFYGTIQLALRSRSKGAVFDESLFQYVVHMYSKRLQVQERLTQQIAEAAYTMFGVDSLMVVCQSAHMCMVARGVEEHASSTTTTAARGAWTADATARQHVLQMLVPRKCK
jgi:GTP cyclohydrolase I